MRPILVMKPGRAGEKLCQDLVSEGFAAESVHFWSAFTMKAPENSEDIAGTLTQAAQKQIPIVIVSPSAVDVLHSYLPAWPKGTVLATVGSGTAEAIRHYWGNDPEIIQPQGSVKESGSEALFDLLLEKGLTKEVVIARGQTGRDFLKDSLLKIGCSVQVLTVYLRIPFEAKAEDKAWLDTNEPNPVVYLTSTDSVDILLSNCDTEEQREWFKGGRVLTIHPRIEKHLKDLNFESVSVIDGAEAFGQLLKMSRS